MSAIFAVLYALHPIAPMLFLVVLINGVAAPPIYFAVRGEAVSMHALWGRAKDKEPGALYATVSWAALALFAILIVMIVLTAKLFS